MTVLQQSPDLQPPDTAAVTSDLFRKVFRRHAVGVAVVATGGSTPTGFTATSLVSLSTSPPMLSFNIGHGSSSWPSVATARHVSVHLLSATQADVATTFATSGIDRFAAIPGWQRGPFGLPVIPGVMAWMAARIHAKVDAGDHALVVAEVLAAHHTDSPPLLFHDGRYATLA